MFGYETMLALALLTAPGEDLQGGSLAGWQPLLRPALTYAALQAELLDPRETRYILARPEDFVADLNMLRRRARDLANAPPADDGWRFPGREVITQMLAANRTYRQHLEARQAVELSHTWSLKTVLQETDELYTIWDMLRDTRSDHQQVTARRLSLKKLRELIGPEAYYSGTLPPNLPLWRFAKID